MWRNGRLERAVADRMQAQSADSKETKFICNLCINCSTDIQLRMQNQKILKLTYFIICL